MKYGHCCLGTGGLFLESEIGRILSHYQTIWPALFATLCKARKRSESRPCESRQDTDFLVLLLYSHHSIHFLPIARSISVKAAITFSS